MCGIAGISGRVEDREGRVRAMMAALAHRGPDDQGYWSDEGCALGHRRLAILDLSPAGRQPLANEDGQVQAVFNGEIYNFAELRAELTARGHRFKSRTDGEVIVHLYEEDGERFVERLRGQFAVGVWDARARRLLLARDHFGQKPLFWARSGGALAFASEIKALRWVGTDIDPQAIDAFLALNFIPAPMTAYAGVRRLEAAHVLTWREGEEPCIRRFWTMAGVSERRVSEADALAAADAHLDRAVKEQLVADVPVGLFLSGGIDSSLIAAKAGKISTFSIGFKEREYSELPVAAKVAEALGLANQAVVIGVDDASDPQRLVELFDEPFADIAALPIMALARRARASVKVALTGDGGDEVFGGYQHHVVGAWLGRLTTGAAWRARAARALAAWVPHDVAFGSRFRRLRRGLEVLGAVDPVRALRVTLAEAQRGALYRPEFLSRVPPPYRFLDAEGPFRPAGDRVLADQFLHKTDMAAMAVGLECRSPFLDVPLAEYLASLPESLKVRGLRGKWLERRLLARYMGRAVWARGKTGLSMPVEEWIRGPLGGLVRDTLLAPGARVYEYVRAGEVERLWREHVARRANWRRILWALLILELWLRRR